MPGAHISHGKIAKMWIHVVAESSDPLLPVFDVPPSRLMGLDISSRHLPETHPTNLGLLCGQCLRSPGGRAVVQRVAPCAYQLA